VNSSSLQRWKLAKEAFREVRHGFYEFVSIVVIIGDIDYQRKLSQMSGADIYGIAVEGTQGCAVIEMRGKDKVLIKELLIADQFIPTAVRQIAQLLPAEKYILRTPPFLGSRLEGTIRLFGMIRANQGVDPESIPDGPGYLGLAFD